MNSSDVKVGLKVRNIETRKVNSVVKYESGLGIDDSTSEGIINWELYEPAEVHSSWAFSDKQSPGRDNYEYYIYLCKISGVYYQSNLDKMSEEELNKLKAEKSVLVDRGSGYAHHKYRIVSNPHNLSKRELALVADSGNLCFGYRMEGWDNELIVIHTD